MPIIWRYLLKKYFQVFSLCILSFVGILLVFRFQTIARFATSGTPLSDVGLFTLFQIPYILPIAIPISCLIAAILLLQHLSHSNELTACRTSGLSLRPILLPILFAGLLLSLINLTVMCEISPRSRIHASQLIYETLSRNPLVVFQKDGLIELKGAHIDMGNMFTGRAAEDILFVSKNSGNQRLSLVTAKHLFLQKDLLHGGYVTMISSADSKQEGFDHLIIENQVQMDTKASHLGQFTASPSWGLVEEQQTLKTLLTYAKEHDWKISRKMQIELIRRFSISLAPFTFTLIGVSFGLHIGRRKSKKGILYGAALAAFYILAFLVAKSLREAPLALLLLTAPHLLIALMCLRPLRRVNRGVES